MALVVSTLSPVIRPWAVAVTIAMFPGNAVGKVYVKVPKVLLTDTIAVALALYSLGLAPVILIVLPAA